MHQGKDDVKESRVCRVTDSYPEGPPPLQS